MKTLLSLFLVSVLRKAMHPSRSYDLAQEAAQWLRERYYRGNASQQSAKAV